MTDSMDRQELTERIQLIETMLAEGRRKTESWGWTFVLWGAAYAGAILASNAGYPFAQWSTWGHRSLAWPVAVGCAMVVMVLFLCFGERGKEKRPDTVMGRAVFSLWIALWVSLPLVLFSLGSTGRLDQQTFVAIIATLLGMTNAASSMILRWRLQFGCALVWWAAAVGAAFSSGPVCLMIFLAAIFLCQIVFGLYGMAAESRGSRQVIHA